MACAGLVNWMKQSKPRGGPKVAYRISPLEDPRWDGFVQAHPRASVFHSSAWLKALSQTYNYKPVAYTTSPANQNLENAIVFCHVKSWLTGHRLVSLPFSDHCEPLVDSEKDVAVLSAALEKEFRSEKWRYVEVRPLTPLEMLPTLQHPGITYSFHQLDLEPDLNTIFNNFHKSSTQRKIRRAESEGLRYCEGSNLTLLEHFYKLMIMTRRRHKLPPQPRKWFMNLMDCFGDALKIRVTYKGDRPIAAMLTLRHKNTLVYKYGCSDPRFNNLGSMHLLYWKSIQEAKNCGFHFFDLGRTDADQQGLITFKSRWGATRSELTYARYCIPENSVHFFDMSGVKWKSKATKLVFAHLPSPVLSIVGQILYRHVG